MARQQTYRLTGCPLTIAAGLMAFAAMVMLTIDAEQVFWRALYWSDYGICVKVIALYAPIYFLMFGTFSYLATRYGYFARSDEYAHRTHEVQIERLYGAHAPDLLILVPSYKEEEEVIRQTLFSAALVEYAHKRVVLLLDDPPRSSHPEDNRRRCAAYQVVKELNALLEEPARRLNSELTLFHERQSTGLWERIIEVRHVVHLYEEVAAWLERQAECFLGGRPLDSLSRTDRFFVENILLLPASKHRQRSREILQSHQTAFDLTVEYSRLAGLFATAFSVFERKQYVNLSHAPNKAMNLNSYIGLLGKGFKEVGHADGMWLSRANADDATLHVPNADYIINLDADTLLFSDYALRLVDIMEHPGNERLAVVQTPYSAYPNAPTMLERVAGATTDVQYLTHQGMTFFSATAWVGANALIRRAALDEIVTYCEERGHRIPIYIQDKTLIEDTAASVDLINKKWLLYNYQARMAYSATPPDFGSFLIQRRRWANGGILIFPNLVHYICQRPLSPAKFAEGFVRANYLLSPAFMSVGMLVLLICSFDDYLFSVWVPFAAIPYQIVYCRDLKTAGYRWNDLPRVYSLNMMLIPIYFGGTLQSLRQAFTGHKAPFSRTPKVEGRTATQLIYLLSILALMLWCILVFVEDLLADRFYHMIFTSVNSTAYLYGVTRFIGLRASLEDLLAHFRPEGGESRLQGEAAARPPNSPGIATPSDRCSES
jgi:cellulose synthase/poly-beta-1,6-N-acetylglucosamine synthase-like glycosyltransferase